MEYPDRRRSRQSIREYPGAACGCAARKQKIKVNIISGFLGAGKTTLLNRVLEQDGRSDILVREYGEAAIDDKLLKGLPQERIHVFFGVSMHDHPQLLLHDYLHRIAAEDADEHLEHLWIETSGLDYPEDIVQLFMVGYMPMSYELDSFTAVVDAQFGDITLDEYDVAVEQVAYADRIVINKADLASDGETDALRRRLRGINAVAEISVTDHGRVDAESLYSGGIYRQLRELEGIRGGDGMDGITTLVLSESRPLDKDRVNAWINGLYTQHGDDILRGKGFLCFAGDDHRYEFQSVRRSFHSTADEKWRYKEERRTTLVLIGKDTLRDLELQKGLSSCAV